MPSDSLPNGCEVGRAAHLFCCAGRHWTEWPEKGSTPSSALELAEIAAAQGCELLQVEFQAGTLRLILDREEGVRLEDCETVSKLASALLDVRNFGPGRYTLEVSSPGLDRQLYGPRDFARFVGRRVRVRFVDPATGKRATVVGRLAGVRRSGGRSGIE